MLPIGVIIAIAIVCVLVAVLGFRFGRPGTAAEISARLAQPGASRITEEPLGPGLALAG